MFFKEDPSIPLPISWPYPSHEVFVTGDFNSFALQQLHEDGDEKCAVIWAPPARIHYRFLVDGTYLHDPAKPHTFMDGKPYNYLDVQPVPEQLNRLKGMSLEELERLDYDLFCTKSLTCTESEFSDEAGMNPTKLLPRSQSLQSTSIGSSLGRIRETAKAAVVIQKHFRRYRARLRFLLVKDAALHIQTACRAYMASELKRLKQTPDQAIELKALKFRIASLETTCEMWAREAKKWKGLAESYKIKVGATLGRSATSMGFRNGSTLTSRATYVQAAPRNSMPSMQVKPSRLSR